MKTNRRKFIRTLGAGAAGMGLASTIPSAIAQTGKTQAGNEKQAQGRSFKMIIRADDVGYTDICNIGAFESMTNGVVTSADVMLDTPGAVDALKRLRELPWISVGWHTHMWGSPVLDPKLVPSLVIKEDGRIRFRKDLRSAEDVVFEEALMECRAQIDRCVEVLGKAPDTGGGAGTTPFSKALSQTCDEYGIVNLNREQINIKSVTGGAFQDLETDSLTEIEKYNPYKCFNDLDLSQFSESDILMSVWHPGWVDYYVYRLGDYGPKARNYILARLVDVEALTSDRLKNWIKENRIELVNNRDIMHGTNEYQNHLKSIGSDLAMI